jgi:hypothetical protein
MSGAGSEGSRRLVPDGLLAAIRDALGADLIGLYLYGSAVAGGFDEDVSDIDLIAVTGLAARDLDLRRLREMHDAFEDAHPDWRGRVEVAYVGFDDLAAFRTSRSLAVVSPGEPLHLRDDLLADWAANWYLVRHGGAVLWGPATEAVIPDVTHEEFVAAVVRYADEVASRDRTAAHPGELAYELLTLARALLLVRAGTAGSKQEAAAWAASRIPGCAAVLDEALATRRSRGRTGFDGQARSAAEACIAWLHAGIHAAHP